MQQQFLPFTPHRGPEHEDAAVLIAEDLEWTLAAETQELWALMRTDASLTLLLDTFLRYGRCAWRSA